MSQRNSFILILIHILGKNLIKFFIFTIRTRRFLLLYSHSFFWNGFFSLWSNLIKYFLTRRWLYNGFFKSVSSNQDAHTIYPMTLEKKVFLVILYYLHQLFSLFLKRAKNDLTINFPFFNEIKVILDVLCKSYWSLNSNVFFLEIFISKLLNIKSVGLYFSFINVI